MPSVIPSHSTSKLGKKEVTISRIKRRFLKHIWLARIILIAGILAGVYLLISLLGFFSERVGLGNLSKIATSFVFTPESRIRAFDGRTNVMVLGKGGEGHTGAELTDTIMFASFSHADGAVTLISLPRDIWISEIRAKLNTAYFWGKQKEEWGGLNLTKSLIEEIVGQPVHYGVVLDFTGFKKVIDVVGGIDVEVQRSFTDTKYPIEGKENDECGGDREFKCRYETITFEEGTQYMDGTTALKFVRSRNAEGEEGTDLARGVRQQKIISAVKEKILNPKVLLSPRKLVSIWQVLKESVESDMDGSVGAILARTVMRARENVKSFVLPAELFETPVPSPAQDNQFVFIPIKGQFEDGSYDWSEIRGWVQNLFQ